MYFNLIQDLILYYLMHVLICVLDKDQDLILYVHVLWNVVVITGRYEKFKYLH